MTKQQQEHYRKLIRLYNRAVNDMIIAEENLEFLPDNDNTQFAYNLARQRVDSYARQINKHIEGHIEMTEVPECAA